MGWLYDHLHSEYAADGSLLYTSVTRFGPKWLCLVRFQYDDDVVWSVRVGRRYLR